jgi:phenylalanyl-tRNA synthetase beta chain
LDLAQHLKLKNPLSSEQAYLRSSLLPSHLATLERNRMYAKSVRFQEISNVFVKRGKGEQPDEPLRLGVTVLELDSAYRAVKGMLDQISRSLNLDLVVRPASGGVYAPGRYGEVWLGDVRVGGIGQLHPTRVRAMKIDGEVAHFELDLTPLMMAATTRPYAPVSAFPTTLRDVTLLLPKDITWQAVREATDGWDVAFVGDYYGSELPAGMKGMTIRLRLSLPDRTPTEAEASELEGAVLLRLRHKFDVQLRG